MKSRSCFLSSRWRVALYLLLGITVLNYVAQIPYYIHFYGIHHVAPSPISVAFLLGTFLLFLVGYVLTMRATRVGAWLLLAFLFMEFVGYLLHNLSGAFIHDLPLGDLLFLVVSLIGYLNFIVSFIYLIMTAINYRSLLFQKNQMQVMPHS